MNKIIKLILYLITILLEIFIYYIWKKDRLKWTYWDKVFCIFVLCCHIPFYFALYFENRPWLDFLHFTVFLSTLFGILVSNVKILLLILTFIIGLQIQWITINKCILNSEEQNCNQNFGFGKLTSIATLLYSCYLAYKIGKTCKKQKNKKRKNNKIKKPKPF